MAKTLFTIKPHSIIDAITNSSSELFVGKSKSKDELMKLLLAIYPDYLNEYEPLKGIDDLTVDELGTYLSYEYSLYSDSDSDFRVAELFGIEPSVLYSNYNEYSMRYWYGEFSDEGIKLLKDKIDPEREMFFLFSLNDNPNWDYQEKLSDIFTRYHLG